MAAPARADASFTEEYGSYTRIGIRLPERPDQSILKLNQSLEKMQVLIDDSQRLVFADASYKQRWKLVHYVILIGWLDSPLIQIADFRELRTRALEAAGIDFDLAATKDGAAAYGFTHDDLLFKTETTAIDMLIGLLEYQRNYAFLGLRKLQVLDDSLYDYFHGASFQNSEGETNASLLSECRAYLKDYFARIISIHKAHKEIIGAANDRTHWVLKEIQSPVEEPVGGAKVKTSPTLPAKKAPRLEDPELD